MTKECPESSRGNTCSAEHLRNTTHHYSRNEEGAIIDIWDDPIETEL
jgi:hypothetical protein